MAALLLALGLAAAAPPSGDAQSYLQKSARAVPAREFRARAPLQRGRRLRTADGALLIGSDQGIVRRAPDGTLAPFPSDVLPPWSEVTVLAEPSPGLFWIGTPRGAIRYDAKAARFEYFAGRRWLPDDRVTGIAFEGPRVVWLETPAGFGRIEWEPMTLAEKARLFEERVRARHRRHGFVGPSRLESAGDLATSRPSWADNDGLWTAVYVASQCFKKLGVEADTLSRPPKLLTLALESKAPTPCPSNVLLRRVIVQQVGGFEEIFTGIYQLYEDQAFLAKVYLAGSVFVASECWDRYRQHADSCVSVVMQAGQKYEAGLFYLTWLERYLAVNGIKDGDVWIALRKKQRRYRYPKLSPLLERFQFRVDQMKQLVPSRARRPTR